METNYRLITKNKYKNKKINLALKNENGYKVKPKNKIKYDWTIIQNLITTINIVIKFKPDTIVSTGAQIGGFFCYVGKFFGAKVIYIETMAKIKELSGTGNNVYKIADKFYVQWKSLEEKYDKAEYIGRLI